MANKNKKDDVRSKDSIKNTGNSFNFSFLKKYKLIAYISSGLAVFGLLVLVVSQFNNIDRFALAGLNCPGGYTSTGGQCSQVISQNKTCTSGALDTGNCVTYTKQCITPTGWVLSAPSELDSTQANCVPSVAGAGGVFYQYITTSTQCTMGNSFDGTWCVYTYTPPGTFLYPSPACPNGSFVTTTNWSTYGCGHETCNSGTCTEQYAPNYYYVVNNTFPPTNTPNVIAAATCPSGSTSDGAGANTCSQTVTITATSYTPDPGNVTAISCDNTNPVAGSNINCSIVLTGAPSGVPYSGNVVLSVGNGGGIANCTLSGTSAVQSCSPVTVGPAGAKTVTTDKGGSLGITVQSAVVPPTTITAANLTGGACSPTSVVSGSSSAITCTFGLTGDSNNNYALPSGGITANTPAGAGAACSIVGNGASGVSLSCPNIVPGTAVGTVTATPTGSGITNPATDSFAVSAIPPTAIIASDITSSSCTNPVVSGGTVTCTASFGANKSGSVAFSSAPDINVSSSSTGCTTPAIGISDTSASCTFTAITVGSPTTAAITATASGGGSVSAGNVVVNPLAATTITAANLSSTGATCTTVQVGTVTTCTYPLIGNASNNYALPTTPITATVPGSTVSPACTIVGNGTSSVSLNCANVPTAGATPGTLAVPTSLGATPTASLVVSAVPVSTIGFSNISTSANCTSSLMVAIPASYNCSFALTGDPNNNYALPSGNIVGHTATDSVGTTILSGSNGDNCSIVSNSTAQASLQCNNIPTTGSTVGAKNVLLTINSANPTTKGTVTLTSPLADSDIPGLNIICNGNNAVYTNSTTTCTFTLPANKTLPSGFTIGIGDATPGGSCTTGTGSSASIVTCVNIPTGSLVGNEPIYGQIGSDAKVDSGEKATVIAPQVVRTGGDFVLGLVGLSTLGITAALVWYGVRRRRLDTRIS
jgi:hypothetical protein